INLLRRGNLEVAALAQLLFEIFGQFVHEGEGLEVVVALHVVHALDADGQVLGHDPGLDGLNADGLQRLREDGSNRVGGGLLALLVEAVVARDSAVRRLRLHRLTIRADEHRRHEPQRAVALRHRVRLHVAVVVLAGPHEPALRLHGVRHHVVDEPVLVPDAGRLVRRAVFLLVDLLEDVLEAAVVLLQDGVLCAQVQRVLPVQRELERGVGEVNNRGVSVEHAERHAGALEVVDDLLDGLPLGRGPDELELALAGHDVVDGLVLVGVRVAADDDGLLPAGDEPRDVLADDGLAEHGAAEDVADGAVGALPHLLELELLDSLLVGSDGGALDADVVLLDGVGTVDSDLVVGLVAVLHAQVVSVQLDVQEREDQLVLDQVPDDPGHLIPEDVDDGSGLYFRHVS
ncbi:unnamed protein product, partial [Plutella xylostella]